MVSGWKHHVIAQVYYSLNLLALSSVVYKSMKASIVSAMVSIY